MKRITLDHRLLLIALSPFAFVLIAASLLRGGQASPSARYGEPGATIAALSTRVASQATQISAQGEQISYLATRGPFVLTPIPARAEPTAYRPVRGAVLIESGRCCAIGKVGQPVSISISFDASSPFGAVTGMRTYLGPVPAGLERLAETEWQVYVAGKNYSVTVTSSWHTLHASVQFRDEAGNLSPIYVDDIAIEGSL